MVTTTSAPWRGGELYMGLMVALSWLSTLALFCGSAVTTAQQHTCTFGLSVICNLYSGSLDYLCHTRLGQYLHSSMQGERVGASRSLQRQLQ